MPLLDVENLTIDLFQDGTATPLVRDVSFNVEPGEIFAIVGESGSGKSVSSLAVMGLLGSALRVTGGEVRFEGKDLLALNDDDMRQLRGRDISMVFQEPMTSLNPVRSIGAQIMESIQENLGFTRNEARKRAIELLREVGVADAERRMKQYPHHFSGGMRQRVMIAIALAANPKLIIADEPTTALDVTIQAQILDLMARICRDHGTALILITHNLGIVARYAQRVTVMYGGRIVESGAARDLYATTAASLLPTGCCNPFQDWIGIAPDRSNRSRAVPLTRFHRFRAAVFTHAALMRPISAAARCHPTRMAWPVIFP